MFTAMTCLEWSCDARQVHVWEFLLLPICGRNWKVLFFCPPKHLWCGHNECISQRGSIWGHGRGYTKNWMMFCEFHQDWFQFVAMYKTHMPHINIMKKFQWEEMQLCEIFLGTFCCWEIGSFQGGWVGWWYSMRTGGCPGSCISLFLIHKSHYFMYFFILDPHVLCLIECGSTRQRYRIL